ncbi:MAG: CBS domain-containing protein [Neolewinella sp.]|jgi:CBS domain-containing protein
MLVSMYMTEGVATVSSTEDASSAVALMAQHRVRCLPVVDRGKLVGVISRTDLLVASPVACQPFSPTERARTELGFTVAATMVRSVVTVTPRDSIDKAVHLLDSQRLNSLVVVENGVVCGVLSRSDILRAFREIVFAPSATRISLAVDAGVDVIRQLLQSPCFAELELRAYAEHQNNSGRFVLVTLAGSTSAVDSVLDTAWSAGVRVLQVERPDHAFVVDQSAP